ncbi:MAG TPA: hypothetical protein VI636_09205 [Candidatus Angelobacter sp.]
MTCKTPRIILALLLFALRLSAHGQVHDFPLEVSTTNPVVTSINGATGAQTITLTWASVGTAQITSVVVPANFSQQSCTQFSSNQSCGMTIFYQPATAVLGSVSGLITINYKYSFNGENGNQQTVFNVTGVTAAAATVHPAFYILSLLYAPPGNASSNGFTNTVTSGTTTTIGSSFQDAVSITFTGGPKGLGGFSLGGNFGFSTTSFDSTATTDTYMSATGSQIVSAEDKVDHTQDIVFLWLNPQLNMLQTGTSVPANVSYSIGVPFQSSGQIDAGLPEPMDIVPIRLGAMMTTPTQVPLGALLPQTVDDSKGNPVTGLPGLALVCADHHFYPNSCNQQNQCGCVASDFTQIVNQDVLLGISNTEAPSALDANRFVSIESQKLEGPQCPVGQTCGDERNTFGVTDSNQTVVTKGDQHAYSVGYTVTYGVPLIWSVQFKQEWTWTNMESKGTINGTSHQAQVTLGTSTHECFENVPIFEDTLYHTFVFQQPTTAGGC